MQEQNTPEGNHAATDRRDCLRARVARALADGDPNGSWRAAAKLLRESDAAACRAADALLDLAESHGPLEGPVLPAQRPASYALDRIAAQIDAAAALR